MKIQIPVMETADLIVAGLSPENVLLAAETARRGKKVFCLTTYPYCGEQKAASCDLSSGSDAMRTLFPEGAPQTPQELKLRLERVLLRQGIPFLYQVFPVRKVLDAEGRFAGLIVTDRTGFQVIAAKALTDESEHGIYAKACGVSGRNFRPGTYKVRRNVLHFTQDLTCADVVREGRCGIYRTLETTLAMEDLTPKSLAAAENRIRQEFRSPETVYEPDSCQFDWQDMLPETFLPTEACPVSRAANAEKLNVFLDRKEPAVPADVSAENISASPEDVVRMDRTCRFAGKRTISYELNELLSLPSETFDVVIVGGGTAGAPGTIAAARAGAKTVCLEGSGALGGVATVGRIGCYYYGNRVGFTTECDEGMRGMGKGFSGNTEERLRNGSVCDVIWKEQWFLDAALSAGADVRFETIVTAVLKQGSRVTGVLASGPLGLELLRAHAVVDSTGSADTAAEAGAGVRLAGNEEPAIQGAGLSPVIPGDSYTNTDFQFICDHDVLDTTRAFVMARDKFAGAFDIITIPNTRERRRIIGDIELQPTDFYAGRFYADTINVATSNFDTHGFIIHPLFMLRTPDKAARWAKVPFRALLPKGLDHILVTGLAVSAHRDCAPLIRMQPDVQNQGYAAGYAAALSVREHCSFREIPVRELQKHLVEKNILPPAVLTEEDHTPLIPEDCPEGRMAAVFAEPEMHRASLIDDCEKGSADAAAVLAFFGDFRGTCLLEKQVAGMPWDKGWNYRGMDQFGMSMSPLDTLIFALGRSGGGRNEVLEKLSALQPDSFFSHFRSVCCYLIRHPGKDALPDLHRLLEAPGMRHYAIRTLEDACRANRSTVNEVCFRNSQLKEFYLAKALSACDPADPLARQTLMEYREGLMGYYAMFA